MSKKEENISKKLEKYLALTKKALEKAGKAMARTRQRDAEIVLDMAKRYYDDAIYFKNKDMLLTALCAVTYAHGWLDCGSKLGLFNVEDTRLFVVK